MSTGNAPGSVTTLSRSGAFRGHYRLLGLVHAAPAPREQEHSESRLGCCEYELASSKISSMR